MMTKGWPRNMTAYDVQKFFEGIGPLVTMNFDRKKGSMGGNMLVHAEHGQPTGRVFVEFSDSKVTKEAIRVLHHLTCGNPQFTLVTEQATKGISRPSDREAFPARFDGELAYHPEIDRYTWKEWVESGKQCIIGNYDVQDTREAQWR